MRHSEKAHIGFTALLSALAASACLAAAMLAVDVPPASADISFCPPGTGAGECSGTRGIAANQQTGDVYVIDAGNNRVNVFSSAGVFKFSFGSAGSGAGQFLSPSRIAIDNTGGPDQGSVYVGTDSFRVQKFAPDGSFLRSWGWDVVATGPHDHPSDQFEICVPAEGDVCKAGVSGTGDGQFGRTEDSIAVGPAGVVYVTDKLTLQGADPPRLERFGAGGAFLGEAPLPSTRRALAIGVDTAGDISLSFDDGISAIRKFSAAMVEFGSPYPLDVGRFNRTLGGDFSSGELFTGHSEARKVVGPSYWLVAHYTAAGTLLRRFGYGKLSSRAIEGVSPLQSASGDVFVSAQQVPVTYLSFPPPGPIAPPEGLIADPVGNTRATLGAEINPEGKATDYHFEYLTEQDFVNQGGFAGPATHSTPTKALPADFDLHLAQDVIGCADPLTEAEEGKCLEPETAYRFKVVATNADGAGEGTVAGEFETLPPLEILATWSSFVRTDSARLSAEVDPLGIPTEGHFEYVEDATYQQSGFDQAIEVPAVGKGEAPIDFGAGDGPLVRSATPYPLKADTTYHYRLVVSDPLLAEPIVSEEHAFTTFAPVAPSTVGCPNDSFRTGASAFLPDCRAYELVSPLDKNNGDIISLREAPTLAPAALEQSSVSGSKLAYASLRAFGDAISAPLASQYIATREPGVSWETHSITPPRGRLVLDPGEVLDTEFKAFSPDLCQAWIRTVSEPVLAEGALSGSTNLYRRHDEECGAKSYDPLTTVQPLDGNLGGGLELQGFSTDGSHTIYRTDKSLPGTGAPGGSVGMLYEFVGGETRYVCLLPGGAPAGGCSAGAGGLIPGHNRTENLDNAISADGSRIFWTAAPAPDGAGKIYLRDSHGTLATGDDTTIAVSEDAESLAGSSASFFRVAAEDGSKVVFTTGNKLFSFEVEGKATTEIAAGVLGVLGWSEDATHAYFVSTQALTGEEQNSEGDKAQGGKPNLYLYAEGEGFSFVGTVASTDANPNPVEGQTSPVSVAPYTRTSRVTADGSHAAFMSHASLTGYDNTDAANGKIAAEVFLYDAASEELSCASCNPTGGRPVGANVSGSVSDTWAAGAIPGWQSNLHAARVLSTDGGRLFFESPDTLSPRDTNGRQDVYLWEAPGKGDCDQDDPSFSERSEGCLDLISSGQSPAESVIRDASPSGEDIFFATQSSLLAHDYGLVDIYDARVGGGLPAPPSFAPGCEGESCQKPPPPPFDPTPASASFEGPGNEMGYHGPPKPRCPKGKRKARRNGKQRCVPRCPKGKRKARRNGKQHCVPTRSKRTKLNRGRTR